jgi:hypothetical protein
LSHSSGTSSDKSKILDFSISALTMNIFAPKALQYAERFFWFLIKVKNLFLSFVSTRRHLTDIFSPIDINIANSVS